MKKSLLTASALSVLLLASCSQNQVNEAFTDPSDVLSFRPSASKQTKGFITDNTSVQGAPFGLFAYYTGTQDWAATTTPNFMFNQTVTFTAGTPGSWTYSPLKYWPNNTGDKLSFFAYWPKTSGVTSVVSLVTDQGAPKIRFTQKTDPSQMVDFVVASLPNQTKPANGQITLPFKHVLTRVNFDAKIAPVLPDGATSINITGMQLLGSTANTGSKYFTAADFYQSATGTQNGGDAAKFVFGSWMYNTTTASTSNLNLSTVLNLTTNSSGYTTPSVQVPGNGNLVSVLKTESTKQHYLFLIPPYNVEGIKTSTDIQFLINYDIVTVDPALQLGYVKTSATKTISLPTGTLIAGRAYKFTLVFDTNALTPVLVGGVTVEGWDETDGDSNTTMGSTAGSMNVGQQDWNPGGETSIN